MKHLTVDEMIDFVSINKLDTESLSLAKRVNSHIMKCEECRTKLSAFQTLYDKMLSSEKETELENSAQDSMDGSR